VAKRRADTRARDKTVIDVQIRPTNCGAGDEQDDVVGMLDALLRYDAGEAWMLHAPLPDCRTQRKSFMSDPIFKTAMLAVVSFSAVCLACGSEQSRPSNTAENVPVVQAPVDSTSAEVDEAPRADADPAMVPAASPQQGSADRSSPNQLATNSASTPVAAPRLSEAQIAMVTDLANSSEVEQGNLAQSKAKSPEVKKFAAMMIKHHTEAKNDQAKLYKQLSLTPTQSQQATLLKEDADKTLGSLRAADGGNFDVAYMNSQVDAHQKVLDSINQELLPAAADQRLVDSLNKMKAAVEAHLNEARSLQATLIKTSGPASTSR
jgi:putative membrane protein